MSQTGWINVVPSTTCQFTLHAPRCRSTLLASFKIQIQSAAPHFFFFPLGLVRHSLHAHATRPPDFSPSSWPCPHHACSLAVHSCRCARAPITSVLPVYACS